MHQATEDVNTLSDEKANLLDENTSLLQVIQTQKEVLDSYAKGEHYRSSVDLDPCLGDVSLVSTLVLLYFVIV